jgi:hypothetical protein
LYILLGLAVLFAVAAITFATQIYHLETRRIEEQNRNKEKVSQIAEKDAPPPKQFETSLYLQALFQEETYGGAFLWSALCFLVTAGAVLWLLTSQSTAALDVSLRNKLVTLTVGGLIGLFTVCCLGVYNTLRWWKTLTGSRENWKDWTPWLPIIAMLVGLGVMFFSLLAARSEERKNATLRRLFYGYNAFLGCLLMLGILAVANVMTFFYFTYSYDWTSSHIYSLSTESKKVIKALDKPVRAYVIMSPTTQVATQGMQQPVSLADLYKDLRDLLTTAAQYNDKLKVEYVAPENAEQNATFQKLLKRHNFMPADGIFYGVLLVYNPTRPDDPDSPAEGTQFLGLTDLEKNLAFRIHGGGTQRDFIAEQSLKNALLQLQEGRTNYMLLFTKGSEEMSLARPTGAPGAAARSLFSLKSALKEKLGYECRDFPLGDLDPATKKPRPIPYLVRLKTEAEKTTLPYPEEDWVAATEEERKQNDDKTRKYYDVLAVVIADPLGGVTQNKLQVLQEYLKEPKGRLITLLDVHRSSKGEIQPTGMETFLLNMGVRVGQDQLLQPAMAFTNVPQTDPLYNPAMVLASVYSQAEPSLASAMQGIRFYLPGARSIQAFDNRTGQYQTRPLLITTTGLPHWPETGVVQNPVEFVSKMTEADLRNKLEPRVYPIAVTVQRADSLPPPGRQQQAPTSFKPYLVVFGDADFLNDENLFGRGREVNYQLFLNTISWIRGRAELASDAPIRVRSSYTMKVPADQVPVWTPGFLILVAVIGAGVGVALLRRR